VRKFVAIALALCMAGCTAQANENLPPSPLRTTLYVRNEGYGTHYDLKIYDTTTGHTWWVIDHGKTFVLDTAGTQSIG